MSGFFKYFAFFLFFSVIYLDFRSIFHSLNIFFYNNIFLFEFQNRNI
jgi:hypothetical protein